MKSFALAAWLLAGSARAISVRSFDAGAATCPEGGEPKCLSEYSVQELEAELQRRQTSPAPGTTAASSAGSTVGVTTTATATTTVPVCSVTDGSGPSAVYPCICVAGGPAPAPAALAQLRFAAAPGPAPAAAGATCGKLGDHCNQGKCSPPPDNFADELADQADVGFESMDTDHDGCLSEKEMTKTFREQVKAVKEREYYWHEEKVKEHHEDLKEGVEEKHETADADGNGCVDKAEFETVRQAHNECKEQFRLMDLNADNKISRQEATTHVMDHMGKADIMYEDVAAIFDAADSNHDNFLSKDEFCAAGSRYHGDGNE